MATTKRTKRKTVTEQFAELDEKQAKLDAKKAKLNERRDREILHVVRQDCGRDITPEKLHEKLIAELPTALEPACVEPQTALDSTTQRRAEIGAYIETITGPNVTADELCKLLNTLQRTVRKKDAKADEDKWEKCSIDVYIWRAYNNQLS